MDAVWLGLAAFAAATMTGVFGVGGGVLLIVLMAQFIPPAVLIPLHALVMLYSNTHRAYIQRAHVRWDYVKPFLLGSLVGVALVSPLVSFVPDSIGQIALGAFVLVSTWRPEWMQLSRWMPVFSGGLTSGLTMFLGATGPMVMSVLPRADWNKHQVVGTHGMAMTFQHGIKAVAFLVMGFALEDWWLALIAMCLGSNVGNVLGAALLGKVPELGFKQIIRWLLTLLALRLLWQSFVSL